MPSAEDIIKLFKMKPLPNEGGYYVETYRASEKLEQANLPPGYIGQRDFYTAILYLLTPDTFSALHKLPSDEIFHFYLGDSVTMLQLFPDGHNEVTILGQDIMNGQRIQVTVPAGTWQGSFLNKGGRFALMGTTVALGFEFDEFELGRRKDLLEQYPDQQDLILKLTRES